jgi:uncharacterized damage-inducible protein DinB
MTHPLIDQLRFTRSEWLRGLSDISDEDGARRLGQMNSISWTVGHLAWHEHRYWLERAQNQVFVPGINQRFGYGAPASTPSLQEILVLWRQVTRAADPFLDTLTTQKLLEELMLEGSHVGQTIGSALRRMTYHYWYHTGEIQAIRQVLGHPNLAEYVGDIEVEAPYRPE